MKLTVIAVVAAVALTGTAFQAQACNPLLSKNFGKVVPPVKLPASMLARNNPRAGGTKAKGSIVGLWHDVHTASDGTLFLEGYDTWNASGTEDELGNLPPASGDLCVGAWSKQGNTVNLTTHVTWLYDLSNNFVGTLNMTQQNQVSQDGNSYTGTFDAKFYDPSGNLFQEITGTTAADRLN
jgi:hypothetical protein